MNINGLNINIHTLEAPASRQDVIAMLEEACAQVEYMNECMAKRLQDAALQQHA